jgi:8-oxo-dGTP pyrophosphatase MutT (NUDIX family)
VHGTLFEPRPAAVVVPIVDVGGEAAVVVTKRPATMVHHRDDWVFPGGRVDPSLDQSPEHAARREVHEELGVDEDEIEIVGRLSSHGPISTGFVIEVFVGIVAPEATIRPDPREVADVAIVPLAALAADDAFHVETDLRDHDPGPIPEGFAFVPNPEYVLRFFTVRPEEHLWGTQANIVHELLCHLFGPGAGHPAA